MKNVQKIDLGLTGYDELFMNDAERKENKLPRIYDVPISEIDDFPDHPFKVKIDEDMDQLNAHYFDDTVREHAADFVRQRLAPAVIPNDGKQTPMRGHPVFIAQHACACCCRGCLNKWYKVPIGTELTENQQERIVNLLMAWIEKQID